jgi:hypothetical protein
MESQPAQDSAEQPIWHVPSFRCAWNPSVFEVIIFLLSKWCWKPALMTAKGR